MCALAVTALSGCEEKQAKPKPVPAPTDRVTFPKELEVEDESVNQFIREAMKTCFAGEYAAFKALWSKEGESTFTAEQYERGWKKADKIKITRLAPVRFAESLDDALADDGSLKTTLIYYVVAEVRLAADIRKPQRPVVLLIRPEDENWRFQHPPKAFLTTIAEAEAAKSVPPDESNPKG